MKTTKELIIADITAKVEAKLANQNIELAKHDIELADFADVKTQIDKAEGEYKKVLDYTNKIDAIKREAIKNTSIDTLPRIISELTNDRDKFISKVRDLGIDENKIPQPKQYKDAIDRVSALSNKAKEQIINFK
jgi:hypothetical protein